MSSVVIAGDTSGSVTLQAPAVSGSTVLTLPTSSGTVLTTASGQVLTAPVLGTPASGSLVNCTDVNYTGFKNRIINGDMVIDQRNAGASVTPVASTYTLDRWIAYQSVASKYSVQQNAGSVTPPVGFTNYIGVTSLSAYSILTSDFFGLRQPIEGFNFANMNWGTANASTVTLSFWVRSSLTGTFGGALINSTVTRSYPFSYSIPVANTWTTISVTIAGDTTGTWIGATNGVGVDVRFGIGSGATYSGTAGSWQAGNFVQPTGTVSVVGTSGATFYITGVQLEKGSVATSFDQRAYSQELAMCQRYYEKSYDISVVPGTPGTTYGALYTSTGIAGSAVGSYIGMTNRFIVSKRAVPTMTAYETISGTINLMNGLNAGASRLGTIAVLFTANTNQFNIEANTGNTLSGYYGQWTAVAEL